MRTFVVVCLVSTLFGCGAVRQTSETAGRGGQGQFPLVADPALTPGKLCDDPDTYRYPEHIPYCSRSVSSATKRAVIQTYDSRDGYAIGSMNRQDFKIDHYVPLCMGGSNDAANLWPQHKSIYVHTDRIEEELCKLMAAGRMRQADAMDQMAYAKHHLDECDAILDGLLRQAN